MPGGMDIVEFQPQGPRLVHQDENGNAYVVWDRTRYYHEALLAYVSTRVHVFTYFAGGPTCKVSEWLDPARYYPLTRVRSRCGKRICEARCRE